MATCHTQDLKVAKEVLLKKYQAKPLSCCWFRFHVSIFIYLFFAIYRCDVAGMEFRCILQKCEPRVCIHYVLNTHIQNRKKQKKHNLGTLVGKYTEAAWRCLHKCFFLHSPSSMSKLYTELSYTCDQPQMTYGVDWS